MTALAVILMAIPFFRFPIFPVVGFLEYDVADVPIMIGAFIYGPISGLIITVLVSGIQALTVSASSGWLGFVMHVLATGSYVLAAGFFYRHFHTLKGALMSLLIGIAVWMSVMIPANILLTPIYYGFDRQIVFDLLGWIALFNIVKSATNSALTFILYKRTKTVLDRLLSVPGTVKNKNKKEEL